MPSLVLDRRSQPPTMASPRAPNFCAGGSYRRERQKPYVRRGGGGRVCYRYKNARFSNGQKLTHFPARTEKHAGQETPLHYTHYRWHRPSKDTCPGLPPLTPTRSTGRCHVNEITGPIGPPVRYTRERGADMQPWPDKDASTCFAARAWREGVCSPCRNACQTCLWVWRAPTRPCNHLNFFLA